ncbi:uncharacterized protein LOC123493211 [Coregonus clupeaformis]|uniref:uncharacterized protein LOC123493211 n=1 Tax=Coregonus clupeaformis TaxID=59861 RepID=UPI001E1C5313|nr:uncharacterized protein LOC123493211 [Coregonus clupeaformis]
MFSGMFTHYIKPALSMQQVANIFGLLGYHASEVRRCEALRLRSPALPVDILLHLSCAFFAACCECLVLQSAIEPQARGVEWELNLVQERQQGHSLQIALDNTKRRLETIPLEDDILDLDLYTAEEFHVYKEVGFDRHPLCSPIGEARGNTSPSITRDSNGVSSQSENVCVSTLSCQLVPTRNASKQSPNKELAKSVWIVWIHTRCLHKHPGDSQICSCMKSYSSLGVSVQHCKNCNTFHSVSCPLLDMCKEEGHKVKHSDGDSPTGAEREQWIITKARKP